MVTEPHLTPAARARVSPHGWRRLPSGIWVTALPLIDIGNRPRFAHLDYETLLAVVARIVGARLIAPERVVELNRFGFRLRPVISPGDAQMSSKRRCDEHDDAVLVQLAQGWDYELPVSGAGKPWVAGARTKPRKQGRLFGWGKRVGSSSMSPDAYVDWHQPLQNAHGWNHVDYSSLCTLEADEDLGVEDDAPPAVDPLPDTRRKPGPTMPTRSTIRLGSKGPDVIAWQMILGIKHDGIFGPGTQAATESWQEARGLVGDGVVGARSWAAVGQKVAVPAAVKGGSYPGDSPAIRAALRDANAAWPGRRKQSDGTIGDLAHQFKPGPDGKLGTADDVPNNSDHNIGNAVDITHDPASGCDGAEILRLALLDDRLQYGIFNAVIRNVDINGAAPRPYKGANKHTHHVHLSMKALRRGDGKPWPWAPK